MADHGTVDDDNRPGDCVRPIVGSPAVRASAGFAAALIVAVAVAGCGGGSSAAGTVHRGSTQRPAAAPSPGLTGFGASKSAWIAAHGSLTGGAFAAVGVSSSLPAQPIIDVHLRFAPVREGIASFNAESQLPADVKVAASTTSATCLQVHYTSQLLARESSVGPDVYASFSSGRGIPYNSQRVNGVVLTTSPKPTDC
jgi:hypothetical protein